MQQILSKLEQWFSYFPLYYLLCCLHFCVVLRKFMFLLSLTPCLHSSFQDPMHWLTSPRSDAVFYANTLLPYSLLTLIYSTHSARAKDHSFLSPIWAGQSFIVMTIGALEPVQSRTKTMNKTGLGALSFQLMLFLSFSLITDFSHICAFYFSQTLHLPSSMLLREMCSFQYKVQFKSYFSLSILWWSHHE